MPIDFSDFDLTLEPGSSVFLSGGVGDILTIDAHLTREQKRNIRTIYWGTRIGRLMIPLFNTLKETYYTGLEEQHDIWDYDDQKELACYININHQRQFPFGHDLLPEHVIDLSIEREFSRYRVFGVKFIHSAFLATTFADINRFSLPSEYAVVVPTTPINHPRHRELRNYKGDDWKRTIERLGIVGLKGVVVNSPCDEPVPDHHRLLDLTGKTTLAEAIEIVKCCSHYVGIDSWASILAAMRLPGVALDVLSRNTHLYGNAEQYYPTHKCTRFVNWNLKGEI